MKLWLVCFANGKYARAQRWLVQSAQRLGFARIRQFRERDLRRTQFFQRHRTVLSAQRGAGSWLWKPYYIAQVLREAAPDDIVVYADAGVEFIADIHPLIQICETQREPVLFQVHGHANSAWTKRDCFAGMRCDEPRYHRAEQVMAAFQLYRRNGASLDFVRQWLDYCCQERLLTDAPNTCGLENFPEFREHRHDQSILSLLATRWELPIYRDPSQWGNSWAMAEFRPPDTEIDGLRMPIRNSPYGQLLDHHRRGSSARRRHRFETIRRLATQLRQLNLRRNAA